MGKGQAEMGISDVSEQEGRRVAPRAAVQHCAAASPESLTCFAVSHVSNASMR